MSPELFASHIQSFADHAAGAPLLVLFFIFLFMAVESSFIPFPSEVVMIPAGFLAYRYALPTGNHAADLAIILFTGTVGALAGAYINYFLSAWLGRPFLRRYGKYVMLSEASLDRAEEIFNKYGDIVTFVCRLLPAIRQLISIPAGLSKMNLKRFTAFTAAGAFSWNAILTGIGYYFGYSAGEMTYLEMVHRGKQIVTDHYLWIILGLAAAVALYLFVHKLIMKPAAPSGK